MDLGAGAITAILFASMIAAIMMGIPLAFALGGVAILCSFFLWGPNSLYIFTSRTIGLMSSILLTAIPLFVFMASILQRSGIGDDLYTLVHRMFGSLNGGLAVATVVVCAIIAAMAGVTAAGTISMGLIALPAMLRRGYDKSMALGCIAAGGALGVLIPPSVTMIVYAAFTGESVGYLFLGGVLPGLLLSSLYIAYIIVRCRIQPRLGPSIPRSEKVPLQMRAFLSLFKGVLLSIAIVGGVLGSIFTGAATPTEAAAVGSALALLAAVVNGTFSRNMFTTSVIESLKVGAMAMWVVIGGSWFAAVYHALGAPELIVEIVGSFGATPWMALVGIQATFFVLGMFIEPIGIIMITSPIFVPIITQLGYDPIWFGVVFVVNMQMAFLTPPFGGNLFYLRGVAAPQGIGMGDIYRSIVPYVGLQAIGLSICILVPDIILFLPRLIMGH